MDSAYWPEKHPSVAHARMLHSMIRVGNLERSLAFYLDVLGMRELRREDHQGDRYTLAFVGYGDEISNSVIELIYNWDIDAYQHGSGFGHIAIGVQDIQAACDHCMSLGINIVRKPGPISFTSDTGNCETIAFIEDPDGYQIELIEKRDLG